MKRLDIKLMVAALCVAVAPAVAADFDGSKPLICSTIETHDCAVGTNCMRGLAEDINVPQFIRIDLVAKTISADTAHARELRQTSPFAGVLSEPERRRLTRAVQERALA